MQANSCTLDAQIRLENAEEFSLACYPVPKPTLHTRKAASCFLKLNAHDFFDQPLQGDAMPATKLLNREYRSLIVHA